MTDEVESLFSRPLLPLANEADAEASCAAAAPRIVAEGGHAYVVHVIEKAGGAPDKASVEQRETVAEDIFSLARGVATEAGIELDTDLRFGTDVGDAILDAAEDIDATAIVFTPRGGRSWWDLFSGDVRDRLVRNSDRPVVVLPAQRDDHSETIDGET
ncbi:universal stress protein [Haloferax elongans]|nr:universal stress protein [Haloferax elongans]